MSAASHAAAVARLRQQIDFSPYEPSPDAPVWMEVFASGAHADLGVLALLGPGGVSVAGIDGSARVVPDPSTLYIAAFTDGARATGRRLAVGLPPFGRHLPLLFAVTALLADKLETFVRDSASSRAGVLVITPDLEIRSRYCDVRIGAEPLDHTYPGSRLRPDGTRLMLSPEAERTANSGVCFFLPQIALPTRIEFAPALIILDVRYGQWTRRTHDLARWASSIDQRAGVVALYTIGDPEARAALTEARYTDLPLDHTAIATCASRVSRVSGSHSSSSIEWTLAEAPGYLARKHRIVEITDCTEVERLLTDLAQLLDEFQGTDNLDLQRATWILAVLRQMPVPMIWYEEASRSLGRAPLRRLIGRLGNLSRDDRGAGAVVQTVRMGLQRLYERLEQANPRAETVKRQLEELRTITLASDIVVVVRDRTVERALKSWIAVGAFPDADWLQQVTVLACPAYVRSATHRFGAALINGAFPRRYRWIAGASLASDVRFIAYEQETRFIEAQLLDIYGATAIRQRAVRRIQVLTGSSPAAPSAGMSGKGNGKADVVLPELQIIRPPRRPDVDEAAKDKTRKLRAVTREELAKEWEQLQRTKAAEGAKAEARRLVGFEDPGGEDAPGVSGSNDDGSADDGESSECLRIDVVSRTRGSGVMWLAPEYVVEFIRPGEGDDILRNVSRTLTPGDVVLRVDEEGRASVFDHVVELAEGQPQLHYLSRWRQVWRAAVERMAAKYQKGQRIDYRQLLGDLQRAGAPIESELAVRLWVEEIVIGPLSAASIVAVGKISGAEALVSQSGQFDNAFRHIRSIRRGIGRRLSSVVRKSFRRVAGAAADPAPDDLEDRLRVPLEELLETIDLAEVQSVSTETKSVPASWVGRFRPRE
jgi:hypothetical protein